MAPLLRELLAEYAATGQPPAYLSSAEPAAATTTTTTTTTTTSTPTESESE